MNALIFKHVPFEGEGYIANILQKQGISFSHVPLYDGAPVPSPEGVDFAIFMGGPMSVNDEQKFPWLAPEKEFARAMILSGKPVLGICLGAQLMAKALGALILKSPDKEIGWFSVSGSIPDATEQTNLFHFPENISVFHWHGETFGLPKGATRLASSSACKNQAFQIGNAIGLQFHMETTTESMENLITNCADELEEPSPWIQDKLTIRNKGKQSIPEANALMESLILHLLGK